MGISEAVRILSDGARHHFQLPPILWCDLRVDTVSSTWYRSSGHPIFFCVDPLCDSLYDQVLPFYVAMGVPDGEILPDNGRKF